MTKAKHRAALKFLFATMGQPIGWKVGVLTRAENPQGNPPDLNYVEAKSVVADLLTRGLILEAGETFGEAVYLVDQTKVDEWRDLIDNTKDLGWFERHRKKVLAGIGAVLLTTIGIIWSTVVTKKTEDFLETSPGSNAATAQLTTIQSVGDNNNAPVAFVANSTNVTINQGVGKRILNNREIELLSAAIPHSPLVNLQVDYNVGDDGSKTRAIQIRSILSTNGFTLKPIQPVVLMATDCFNVWFYISTNYPYDKATRSYTFDNDDAPNAIRAIISVLGKKPGLSADNKLPPNTIRIIVGKGNCD